MALSDRLKGLAGWAGQRLHSYSTATPKRIEGVGIPMAQENLRGDEKAKRIITSREALFGSISMGAGPNLTRYSTYPATALDPGTITAILKEADLGIVYRYADMVEQILDRDSHIAGVDRARRVETSGKSFRISPIDERPISQSLAKLLRAVVDNIDGYDQAVYQLLGANPTGWSSSEIIWDFGKVRFPDQNGKAMILSGLLPMNLEWVHQKHFGFATVSDEPLLNLGQGGFVPLPPHKFIFHKATGEGLTARRGYMRRAVWLHMLKSHAIRDWAVFLELFGIPNIYGLVRREDFENPETKTILALALQDYGQGKPVILPDDLQINSQQGPTPTGTSAAHNVMVSFCNQELSKLIQGETLTTELSGLGSYNASETHAQVKHAIITADAKSLASDVRSDLFKSFVELNINSICKLLGADPDEVRSAIPQCGWRIEREVTPSQRQAIIQGFANSGLEISEEQIRDEFALDPPPPGGKALRGEPFAVASGSVAVGSLEASNSIDNPKPEGKEVQG